MRSDELLLRRLACTAHLVGGIAGEFYTMNAAHYNTTAPPSFDHEPHVAQASFGRLLTNSSVAVLRGSHGANVARVDKEGTRIVSLHTADGRVLGAPPYHLVSFVPQCFGIRFHIFFIIRSVSIHRCVLPCRYRRMLPMPMVFKLMVSCSTDGVQVRPCSSMRVTRVTSLRLRVEAGQWAASL